MTADPVPQCITEATIAAMLALCAHAGISAAEVTEQQLLTRVFLLNAYLPVLLLGFSTLSSLEPSSNIEAHAADFAGCCGALMRWTAGSLLLLCHIAPQCSSPKHAHSVALI